MATKFYEKLYKNEKAEIERFEEFEEREENEPENEPKFIEEEIEVVIKELKPKKAPGHDKIINEYIKFGGSALVKKLTKLFNEIVKIGRIPQDWRYSDVIIIHKKESKHNISNYGPISLLTTMARIFSKVLEKRVRTKIIEQQSRDQARFRKGYSTIGHLQVVNQLIEKSKE